MKVRERFIARYQIHQVVFFSVIRLGLERTLLMKEDMQLLKKYGI